MGGYYRPTDYGSRIVDLMQQRGQIQAQGAARSGEIWGNALGNIGQLAGQYGAQYAEQQKEKQAVAQMAKRDAAIAQFVESWDGQDPKSLLSGLTKIAGPEGRKMASDVLAFQQLSSKAEDLKTEKNREVFNQSLKSFAQMPYPLFERWYGGIREKMAGPASAYLGIKPEDIPEAPTPEFHAQIQSLVRGPEEEYTLGEGQVRMRGGQQIAAGPAKPEKPIGTHVVDGNLVDDTGKVLFRAPREPKGPSNEPLEAVMDPTTGRPVLKRRSDAVGMSPASSREQGRAVTSGDAGRFAELQTSLDDLATLRDTLSEGGVGTLSRIGAAIPGPVTELTGWGQDAKARQATIDRVKQVIGKALEGGVLRKEDELKYSKILPTIGDDPDVAKAKMDGLDRAIRQRLQRELDARQDAGYDVSRFNTRSPAGQGGPVRVSSPEEAMKLPKGTPIILPDGSPGVVP